MLLFLGRVTVVVWVAAAVSVVWFWVERVRVWAVLEAWLVEVVLSFAGEGVVTTVLEVRTLSPVGVALSGLRTGILKPWIYVHSHRLALVASGTPCGKCLRFKGRVS
jgi:hypothetical protein